MSGMKVTSIILLAGLLMMTAAPASADVYWSGYLQGLYGGRLDNDNPTATELTAAETRLQLRLEHFGDRGELFARMDFVYDGADSSEYDFELREGYFKFRLGSAFDVKVGRQILTWGTGDLIFINDNFAKDYRSFFIGRDDQYLKAPQDAIRIEYYSSIANLTFVWTPQFEPNRLPTGRRLSYYNPMAGGIVGEGFYFDPPAPASKFENGEFSARLQRRLGNFTSALYAYVGFYKNPTGVTMLPSDIPGDTTMTALPVYPELSVYGASVRGPIMGGIVWIEGGYLDSRNDPDGDDPLMPNSSVTGLAGFERQIATDLTANVQWQADYMIDHDKYAAALEQQGIHVRDEVRHLLTSRITKQMMNQTLTLSAFGFYSPTDEDGYGRFSVEYKYTDEVTLAAGGNLFDGNYEVTEFGQFRLNDNVWLKMTYGFF